MTIERQTKKLETIIRLANEVLAEVQSGKAAASDGQKRTRRSGKDLVAFRKMLKSERKKGTPVAQLAEAHGISQAYIYQLQ